MRISPLAIYTALLNSPEDEVFNFVQMDTQLTHSHPTALLACKIWVLVIQ